MSRKTDALAASHKSGFIVTRYHGQRFVELACSHSELEPKNPADRPFIVQKVQVPKRLQKLVDVCVMLDDVQDSNLRKMVATLFIRGLTVSKSDILTPSMMKTLFPEKENKSQYPTGFLFERFSRRFSSVYSSPRDFGFLGHWGDEGTMFIPHDPQEQQDLARGLMKWKVGTCFLDALGEFLLLGYLSSGRKWLTD